MENRNIMYSAGYALCIIANGKVLPELADGSVLCPYNAEYRIRLHNKNDRRAQVKIWIDGEEITKTATADGLVIGANTHIDLERPLDQPVHFKFVSRDTWEAADAGKDGPDPQREMGVIRVEFIEEADLPRPLKRPMIPHTSRPNWYYGPDHWGRRRDRIYGDYQAYGCSTGGQQTNSTQLGNSNYRKGMSDVRATASFSTMGLDEASDDSGCTVEGSYSDQKFRSVNFRVSNKPAVILQVVLKGGTETAVQAIRSSLKKARTDKLRRQQIADLEQQMAAMQDTLEHLKNS